GEGRALALAAADLNFAGMFLNDSVGHGKTEPGSSPLPFTGFCLGGEEWIVDAVQMLGRNAVAGVRNHDTNAIAVGRAHAQRPSVRHSVFRVEEKIQENLLQLAAIAHDAG